MESKPIHERKIDPAHKRAALESFANDDRLRLYGTLLGYLAATDRPDDARLFVDEPGQVTTVSLELLFHKLSHARADAWSFELFEAAMAHRPALPPSNSEGSVKPLSLSFEPFQGREERALRALELLIAAYGVDMPLQYGDTLLNAVAKSASGPLIARVLDAGARSEKRNGFDELPFDSLLSSSSLGRCDASTLRRLAVGRFPKVAALSRFLLFAATAGRTLTDKGDCGPRPVGEILDVVRVLIELGASAGPFRDVPSPLAAALLLPLPTHERTLIVDALSAAGRCGATLIEALPDVVRGFAPEALRDALDRANHSAGHVFDKSGRTLLHIAATEGAQQFWDHDFVDSRFVPVVELLLERGESADAKDVRGKTPLDLARKEKAALGERWTRVEALLRVAAQSAPKGLDRLGDAGFAVGVLGALLEAKKLDRKKVNKALLSLEGDDENARESEAVDALLELPVADADLSSVRSLSFAFEAEIYALIEKASGADSGGESDTLNVASIEGVTALRALEELSLEQYALGVTSLAPLAGHPSLRVLRVAGGGPFDGADALLSVASLERVLGADDVEARLGPVAAALVAKGVKVGRAARAVATAAKRSKAPSKAREAKTRKR